MAKMDNGYFFKRALNKSYRTAVYGEGIYIFDDHGKRYIDASGSAIVVSLGYGNKVIEDKMREQLQRMPYVHTSFFLNKPVIELSERIVGEFPEGFGKVYFASGGSEANESAIKLARQYFYERGDKKKHKILSRMASYHGNTLGALALSGNPHKQKYFLRMLKQHGKVAPAYCYRCCFDKAPQTCSVECAENLEEVIKKEGKETIAAFIAEPIVGSSGSALVPHSNYFRRIREICDKNEILLILDEIMTGMGRTGEYFAFKHFGAVPDMVTLGKGLSSGYVPLSALVVRDEIVDIIRENSGAFVNGFTFSGHALAAEAGNAVFNFIDNNNILEKVRDNSAYFMKLLEKMKERHCHIGDVRGKGFMMGVEFVEDQATKKPFPKQTNFAKRVCEEAFNNGLMIYPGVRIRQSSGAIRVNQSDNLLIAPHLITTKEEIDEIANLFELSLVNVIKRT